MLVMVSDLLAFVVLSSHIFNTVIISKTPTTISKNDLFLLAPIVKTISMMKVGRE